MKIRRGQLARFRRLLLLPIVATMQFHPSAKAQQPLDLATAEVLAMADDPAVRQLQALASALSEQAVSASQLPDPKLKLGAAALPVDTFDLDQEPMTQLQFGIQQHFPAGQSRSLRGRQLRTQASAQRYQAMDRQLQTLRSVREDYLEALFQERAGRIIDQSRDAVVFLLDLTRAQYSTGRIRQQDVYQAELELSRLDEKAASRAQQGEIARARLATWVGASAYGPLEPQWPSFNPPPSAAAIRDALADHPHLAALREAELGAQLGVDLARQQRRPGWMLDLTYGDRHGRNLNGSSRADFLSAMVTIDLPLFPGQRQDREIAAAAHRVDASVAARESTWRQMQRAAEQALAARDHLQQRLSLFADRLLPQAADHSAAAMDGYRSGVSSLDAAVRAVLTEYQLRLEQARIRADALLNRAQLKYFAGEKS